MHTGILHTPSEIVPALRLWSFCQDFYNLFDNWLLKDQVPPLEQQHFIMAVLIRGGVFGDAS